MTDLGEMRQIAEAATPGPWEQAEPRSDRNGHGRVRVWTNREHGESFTHATLCFEDATHIATFDPPTVLALLDEIERQASEIERLREYIECYGENELALYDSMVAAALNEEGT